MSSPSSSRKRGRPSIEEVASQQELLRNLISPVGVNELLSPVNFTQDDRIKTLLDSIRNGEAPNEISSLKDQHAALEAAKQAITIKTYAVAVLMANILFKDYQLLTISNNLQVALVTYFSSNVAAHFKSDLKYSRSVDKNFKVASTKVVSNIALVVNRI